MQRAEADPGDLVAFQREEVERAIEVRAFEVPAREALVRRRLELPVVGKRLVAGCVSGALLALAHLANRCSLRPAGRLGSSVEANEHAEAVADRGVSTRSDECRQLALHIARVELPPRVGQRMALARHPPALGHCVPQAPADLGEPIAQRTAGCAPHGFVELRLRL